MKSVEEIKDQNELTIVFPHQLFKDNPALNSERAVLLVEEELFFGQYAFHKQKLAYHRASMQAHGDYLEKEGFDVFIAERADIRKLLPEIEVQQLHIIDPTDNWLEKRIKQHSEDKLVEWYENPSFLNKREELLNGFFKPSKKSFFQTTFYKQQRKAREILIDEDENPAGGKWTYDKENRKKYPKDKTPPSIHFPDKDDYWEEAVNYVQQHYSDHPGALPDHPYYPYTFETVQEWLDQFLANRFHEFGPYEDAIVKEEIILHHSVLTPMLNVGLLTPDQVLEKAIAYAEANDVPMNSLEGFVRQIMGWREFIRGMYEAKGSFSRTKNYWGFNREIPASFYDGSTGIPPIDDIIKKVLKTGYCHHIERLMILGNFMLLCEFHPDAVYRWFMELFIDAYDWVMVPNVYGMTQFADGGTFATKPYISSSNYIMKMSNYQKGDWQQTWDGLFWRFMHEHRDFFEQNPRLRMLVKNLDRMSDEKLEAHLTQAADFLDQLDASDGGSSSN